MKTILLVLVATSFLSGCVAVVAGAAGATIANPKGAGQVIENTGEAIRDLGKDVKEKTK
jgi:hypothetical protein